MKENEKRLTSEAAWAMRDTHDWSNGPNEWPDDCLRCGMSWGDFTTNPQPCPPEPQPEKLLARLKAALEKEPEDGTHG